MNFERGICVGCGDLWVTQKE